MDMLTTIIIGIPMLFAALVASVIFFWVLPWLLIPFILIILYVTVALVVSRKKQARN